MKILAAHQPPPRAIYAYTRIRAGDFLVFVEDMKDCYRFLYLPGANPFYLTLEDFATYIKDGTLEFVEQLPDEIFNESLALSNKNVDLSFRKRAY